jgi:asparagine synthetase B (glutamine-hydrolysing)
MAKALDPGDGFQWDTFTEPEIGLGRVSLGISNLNHNQMEYPNIHPLPSEFDYMDEFLALMRQSVARQSPKGIPAGLLFSGGLNSHTLLAYLLGEHEAIHSFTWGDPNRDRYPLMFC